MPAGSAMVAENVRLIGVGHLRVKRGYAQVPFNSAGSLQENRCFAAVQPR